MHKIFNPYFAEISIYMGIPQHGEVVLFLPLNATKKVCVCLLKNIFILFSIPKQIIQSQKNLASLVLEGHAQSHSL